MSPIGLLKRDLKCNVFELRACFLFTAGSGGGFRWWPPTTYVLFCAKWRHYLSSVVIITRWQVSDKSYCYDLDQSMHSFLTRTSYDWLFSAPPPLSTPSFPFHPWRLSKLSKSVRCYSELTLFAKRDGKSLS